MKEEGSGRGGVYDGDEGVTEGVGVKKGEDGAVEV